LLPFLFLFLFLPLPIPSSAYFPPTKEPQLFCGCLRHCTYWTYSSFPFCPSIDGKVLREVLDITFTLWRNVLSSIKVIPLFPLISHPSLLFVFCSQTYPPSCFLPLRMMGLEMNDEDMFSKLSKTKELIDEVNNQFKNPELTTFVCVCIPEFLSVYETERLLQELTKFEMDSQNLVVNQVLFPNPGMQNPSLILLLFSVLLTRFHTPFHTPPFSLPHVLPFALAQPCGLCNSRAAMQKKYLDLVNDLYEHFHVVKMPLLESEVRGLDSLTSFSKFLFSEYQPLQH
jgi:hypothetical protein